MPKLKTHKATAKRFRTTKRKKLLHRTSGQSHFNSRERGKTATMKRKDRSAAKSDVRAVKRLMPHHS